ncbi:hypothetical protein K3495_g2205 [Podosphaera aphanis]|nr:hypothetical protein K3495_g2205 [Podosphaera aphanis]
MAIYPLSADTTPAFHAPGTEFPAAALAGYDIAGPEDRVPDLPQPRLASSRKQLALERYRGGQGQTCRELRAQGREGTRRRQRYENANFLNIPNAQPPLPSDWEVHPTYPVHHNLPYYLAPLWEGKYQRLADERAKVKPRSTPGQVPRDLKAALKKAKGARNLLQDIEGEIRAFIQTSIEETITSNIYNQVDTDDEDIVFVGLDQKNRDIVMSDEMRAEAQQNLRSENLVFEGTRSCDGFARWLVHELAEYYGLESRSEGVEKGNNHARKRVVVGFGEKRGKRSFLLQNSSSRLSRNYQMPRPLWGLV